MKNSFKSLLIYTLLAFSLPVMAEDTDLFTASANPTELPNIMIVMDNGANFSASAAGSTCIIGDGGVSAGANQVATALSGSVGGIEQCALYKVVSDINPLPTDADTPIVNIGFMMYNANGMKDINNNPCTTTGGAGGCLLQPLVPLNKANKVKLLAWIRGWKSSGPSTATSTNIKVNNGVNGAIMQETWAYFTGRTGISGRSYASIKPTGKCNNFVVFVGNAYGPNGTPSEGSLKTFPRLALLGGTEAGLTADMKAAPAATDAQKALINNSVVTSCGSYTITANDADAGFMADEWARYMSDKGIITYTVGLLSSACKPAYPALLTNMAAYGGEYFPTTDYNKMVAAFKTILRKTQAVNSAFASVSLPVSVNTQGTFLNQVYIGMFRPDQSSLPRWQGNLKQYKLGELNGVLQLLDADDAKAISVGEKGFLDGCARSFWTPTSLDTYWSEKPKNNCATAVDSDVSNYPDGNIVEKGAQAYKLRSIAVASRNVKTCTSCSPSDFGNFNISNTNITQALLGASTTTERDAIINWARGLNNGVRGVDNLADEVFVAAPATAMRPSSHGDVVHSRPIAINYGTDVAPSVVVYYGGNDGMLRAVNGNRSANIGSTAAGAELWSFVAPEFYSKIKRIRDNASTGVSTVDEPMTVKSPTNISGTPKPYGVDGVITAYKNASNAYIYTTMRRGGRAVYAFDVTTPASPTLKWRIGCPNANNDSGCTSGFDGLGQTWSAAKIINAAGYNSGASPLLIMGGGYDICHDANPNTSCSSSSKGNKIYVIDANTGTLLKTFNTDASVVGDITVVQNSAGLATYAYAADMAGNVYRISGDSANTAIGNTAPDNWTITKIAALGGTGVDNRKFMFAPDVVIGANDINFVLLGSGDREKPLAGGAHTFVQNRFYVIKDKPTASNWLSNENAICSANVMCNASLLAITISGATPTAAELEAKKGWYLALASSEQVVTSAITVFNTITFSTHRPTPPVDGACTTLGTATVYNLNYKNGDATNASQVRGETIIGGGLPPSPVAGMVILDNGQKVPFIIGANPESALQGGSPAAPAGAKRPKSRVYWNIKK